MSEPAGIKNGGAEDGTSVLIADGAPVEQRKEDPSEPPVAAAPASDSRKGVVTTKKNKQRLVASGGTVEVQKKDPPVSNPIASAEVAATTATQPALVARKKDPPKPQAPTAPDPMPRNASTTGTTTDIESARINLDDSIFAARNSTADDPPKPRASTAPNPMPRNASTTGTTTDSEAENQVLFEPFVSLTFSEVKLGTCGEKAWNVHQVNKRMLGLMNRLIPIYKTIFAFTALMILIFIVKVNDGSLQEGGILFVLIIVAFVIVLLWLIDFTMTIWFNVTADPMQILIEARDIMGGTSYFIITDKRSRASRMFKWRLGSKMELARLEDPNNPILTTSTAMLACTTMTSKIELERVRDGATLASYELYRCCGHAQPRITLCSVLCCKPVRTTLYCAFGEVVFVQPLACNRHDGNVIEPNQYLQANELAVQKNAFSCKDFFFETVDLLGADDTSGDTFEDIVGEDAADAGAVLAFVNEANEIKDGYKDALSEFKEKGYKKLGTAKSVWDVQFQPGMNGSQKCAVVLFVLKQYAFED